MGYKEIFTNIYYTDGFGSTESKSGPGSTLAETLVIREQIKQFIVENNIKTIVDIPCGDFHWMKEIADSFESYLGGDIVDELIQDNKIKYENDKIKFTKFDLLEDEIPVCDLLIVRDVIGHFTLELGTKIVEKIKSSKCKFLLSTTWAQRSDNRWGSVSNDVISNINTGANNIGAFYPVHLLSSPFNFSLPEFFIEEDVRVDKYEQGVRKTLGVWDMHKLQNQINGSPIEKKVIDNLTIVSGLWNINRDNRKFEDFYLPRFIEFLGINANMILFLPEYLEQIVWKYRKKSNTSVIKFELEDIKKLYYPHWDKTQEIRTSKDWLNITGENGWLKNSPQAMLEYYNPIVQSKMFLLHDASIYNTFNTDYFYWIDAGITNTVPATHLVQDNCLANITKYTEPFLFLSYPYIGAGEIHGFLQKGMDSYAKENVKYVCRGGLFGGHKEQISHANGMYYSLLQDSLNAGYMGTEESIFSLMAHIEPYTYRRFSLDENGLIVKFTDALIKDNVKLIELSTPKPKEVSNRIIDLNKYKTNLYILTFNFPDQLLHTIESMKKVPEWLEKPNLILLDNSTKDEARIRYQEIASIYGFEYINLGENKGICGGRQLAAEHFHDSDADFYFFFEDDMTSNSSDEQGNFCRNGFRKYIPRLYDILHRIIIKEDFDFLKLSFTEVYWDNNIQTSWYNVPQEVRTKFWPKYDKLPVTGSDPHAPRTNFNRIDSMDGVAYITGDVTYTNWPMIMSKKGNQKVFIDTKWANPFEQTWMSHVFQMQKKGEINAAVLLASPIWHDRIKHYKPEERREN